jgi:hypothetical protein
MKTKDCSKKPQLSVKKMFQALPAGSQEKAQSLANEKYPMRKSINIGALKAKGKK